MGVPLFLLPPTKTTKALLLPKRFPCRRFASIVRTGRIAESALFAAAEGVAQPFSLLPSKNKSNRAQQNPKQEQQQQQQQQPKETSNNKMKSIDKYLSRIGLSSSSLVSGDAGAANCDRETLASIMKGQSLSIAFENLDVVQKRIVSMDRDDVETKLVDRSRGGYCFEQNTLLMMALKELGYEQVQPLLCRVRWGKKDDAKDGPNTAYTHMALKVKTNSSSNNGDEAAGGGKFYLADVGFAGTNSIEPIDLCIGQQPQQLSDGKFRVVPSKHGGNHYVLELLARSKDNNNDDEDDDAGEWRPLYEWRDEPSPVVDLECSNWFSCTYPKARFTTQFFVCRTIGGDEKHHILNDEYVIRKGYGPNKLVTKEKIADKSRLLELVDTVFGIKLTEKDKEGIDRFLVASTATSPK